MAQARGEEGSEMMNAEMMRHNEYRNKFRNKAKVRGSCDKDNCFLLDGIICPLPLHISDEGIARNSHVCITGFIKRGIK